MSIQKPTKHCIISVEITLHPLFSIVSLHILIAKHVSLARVNKASHSEELIVVS